MTNMKKIGVCLMPFVLLIAGCGKNSTNRNLSAVYQEEQANKTYPIEINTSNINVWTSDTQAIGNVSYTDTAETIDEFVNIIDAIAYNSLRNEPEMYYIHIGDELRSKYSSKSFLATAVQAAPISHNFLLDYDTKRYASEGLIGITVGLTGDYASMAEEDTNTARTVSYIFYEKYLHNDNATISYDALPLIQSQAKKLEVDTSEQLFYAVNNGYIPIPKEGSAAQDMLQRATAILSRIIDMNMSQLDMYTSIYQYTILSNLYDYTTAENESLQNRTNKAMFLEGSLYSNIAVCDGLTKEIVLLSRLMGIESYHVGARSATNGHAYVYVNINGDYYLSCPTSGINRMPLSDTQWLSYHTANYMLTDLDTNMTGWQYESDGYMDIYRQMKANPKTYDFWENTSVNIEGQTISLAPSSCEEAYILLKEAKQLCEKINMPVEIELKGSVSVLKEAYEKIKQEDANVLYLSSGTFEGERLQTYIFGVVR